MDVFVLKTKATILGSWQQDAVANPTWRKSSVPHSWRFEKVAREEPHSNMMPREMITLATGEYRIRLTS